MATLRSDHRTYCKRQRQGVRVCSKECSYLFFCFTSNENTYYDSNTPTIKKQFSDRKKCALGYLSTDTEVLP